MARHLVADLWDLFLRPGVAQRQGSRTDALFLSSALHISLFPPVLASFFCFFFIREASLVAGTREDRGVRP